MKARLCSPSISPHFSLKSVSASYCYKNHLSIQLPTKELLSSSLTYWWAEWLFSTSASFFLGGGLRLNVLPKSSIKNSLECKRQFQPYNSPSFPFACSSLFCIDECPSSREQENMSFENGNVFMYCLVYYHSSVVIFYSHTFIIKINGWDVSLFILLLGLFA